MAHFLLKYVPILFVGGFLTSYAEYRFKYSLYETIISRFSKKKS